MLYVSLFFDFVLIGLLAAGISYAVKLTKQLAEMRASRAEMERFVLDSTRRSRGPKRAFAA
jgi:hypothetical protein